MSPAPQQRAGQPAKRPRVLFATSNGTGLGHLTRSMAIARRLPHTFAHLFFTLSGAAPVVADTGFAVDYHPGYRTPGAGSNRQWNLRLRDRLELLLDEVRPDLLVFDGVHPYRALTHVISARSEPVTVWCRRPMWRPRAGGPALRRSGAFDLVLEPGELARAADRGRTTQRAGEAIRTDPIVYLEDDELLERPAAERELGLEPGGTNVLVALGQGGAVDEAVARCLRWLDGREQVRVAALESSLSVALEVPDDVVHVRGTFPISRLYRAFDFVISAAGYNAYHELLRFAIPTLFVPMPRELDDQQTRARYAADAGIGLAVDGPGAPELERRLDELLDGSRRTELATRARELWPGDGAGEAAELVARLAGGGLPRAAPPGTRLGTTAPLWRRELFYAAHRFGPGSPLALALGARELARDPRLRPPRAAILALAVPRDELESRLQAALDRLGRDPARVLVITDSLDLPLLRRLGVAVERVPAPEELASYPGAESYEELVRGRVEAALHRRPGITEIVSAGERGDSGFAEIVRSAGRSLPIGAR